MTAIEKLASAIAFLDNQQLDQLVDHLIRDYEPRAERLSTMIQYASQDLAYERLEILKKDYLGVDTSA